MAGQLTDDHVIFSVYPARSPHFTRSPPATPSAPLAPPAQTPPLLRAICLPYTIDSQGCFIGCPHCDQKSGRRQTDLCGLGKKQTLTDPNYWSVNRDAVPFSSEDIYQHNPWRAPGSAPVQDACGLAGGSYSRSAGSEAGDYTHTKFAQHGDIGTEVLKALPNYTPPTWKLVRGGGGEGERQEQRQAESDGDGDGDGIL